MSEFLPIPQPVNFLFDIIVTRIQLFKDKIEDPKDLIVNVKFNKVPVNITQSRINVTEFKAGRRTEMREDSATLRKNLEASGMPIVVRYKGATLGLTQLRFPQDFIDRIEVGMSDLMHAETCSIIRREQEVGIIELLVALVIKCDEPDNFQEEKAKCRNLGKFINAPDVMFLVGEPQPCRKPSQPCLDELDPDEGDERLRLDLERYRSLNERIYAPPEEICGMEACCELKNMTEQYGHIIDSVVRQMSKLPSPMPDDECVFTDWSGKGTSFMPRHVDRTIPVPVGDLEVMGVKPIRFCPVCLTPMSYLPKYASCPTCCIKPMPQIDEESEEKLTADQIIQQYLKVPTKDVNEDFCHDPCKQKKGSEEDSEQADGRGDGRRVSGAKEKQGKGEENEEENREGTEPIKCKKNCRCTCTKTKLCVHCRIRKLCADIFKRKGVDRNPEECPVVKAVNSNEDFAVIVDEEEEDCRPYLERVFAELRDLYDRRDAAQQELDKRCTQSLLKFGSHRRIDPADPKQKSSSSSHTLKPVGSPTFLHRTPLPKIGHKTCLKQHGIVSRRHGWSWTSSKQARKYGWRPGAICRYAGAIMKFFLHYSPDQNACNTCRKVEEEERQRERRKPILNICKRNGAIFITLRAANNPSPNIEMKPIVFKIVKSDLAVALKKLKRKLKDSGFRKCTCHQTLMMCVCRKNMEKKQLERALQKECQRLGLQNCVDQLILTDTSDSEVEYDFDISPPAAIAKPLLAIKPRTVNISTQTRGGGVKEEEELEEQPWHVEPRYPAKLSPYWRTYDCAAGDRYTGTALGEVGETVFEDGVFGFRGGGPHGDSATPGSRPKSKGIWGAKPGGPMRGGGRDGSAGGGGGKRAGGAGAGTGAHFGQGDGPVGGFGGGFGGGLGDRSFPGAKKEPGSKVKSRQIPVRMPQRYYKAVAAVEKAKKDAVKHELEKKKKGTHLIKYLEEKGAVPKPWDPNDAKDDNKTKTSSKTNSKRDSKTRTGPVLGKDGLTDAQRNRRALLQMAIPPLETLARLGKGFDPSRNPAGFDPCSYECCFSCYNYC
ncbi:uncharacterized protein LOC117791645 [Drosophila innubila]|uniref:uncharacterized protein LOC117791645 n=1 Tax=Drosophila innubila TaxID=198719 RepID=UPI00148D1C49|nr:uncharacterized protein LOC117791645 [Drosophila innubila]